MRQSAKDAALGAKISGSARRAFSARSLVGLAIGGMSLGLTTLAPSAGAEPLQNGRIGYVLTERHWALYQNEDERLDCPQGFNIGPREQFDALFPQQEGLVRTELETRLMREGERFHLSTAEDGFPFHEAVGDTAYGVNLDRQVSAEDFHSPAGVPGVDNQLQRALGCIPIYRGPDGTFYHFSNLFMYGNAYNRWMIELSGVDDLRNDPEVSVTFYRGLDDLVSDASGTGFVPGGTQRVDARWGQSFIQEVRGSIRDGVLRTEPTEVTKFPWSFPGIGGGFQLFRDFQLELAITPQTATGVLAGYADVEQFHHRLNRNWTTHHQSYGQLSAASLYRAMKKLADGHPDPQTGANTAISAAVNVVMHQVYILHPNEA